LLDELLGRGNWDSDRRHESGATTKGVLYVLGRKPGVQVN